MKESVHIIRFIIIGTLNALITAFVVWLMMKHLSCNYIWSNVVAYLVAQTHNFIWCKYWVFPSDGRFVREIPFFLIAFAVAYGVQFLVLLFLVEICDMNAYWAQFIGLVLFGVVNYLMNRFLTFIGRKKREYSNANA